MNARIIMVDVHKDVIIASVPTTVLAGKVINWLMIVISAMVSLTLIYIYI